MSMNRWGYVNGNPINFTDPTGNKPRPPVSHECTDTFPINRINIDYADKNVKLSKSDWLNTYAAAGIAVQCWADILPVKFWEDGGHRSGTGDAQVSDRQVEGAYGKKISGNGFGLRCYIPIGESKSCPICLLPWEVDKINREKKDDNYFNSIYKLEEVHDQKDPTWATTYMQRRIKSVTDSCVGKCTSTDLFIAAALAQGAAISPSEMHNNISINFLNTNENRTGTTINWIQYFTSWGDAHATAMEVNRFVIAIEGLQQKGWQVPFDLDWDYIRTVRSWSPPVSPPIWAIGK